MRREWLVVGQLAGKYGSPSRRDTPFGIRARDEGNHPCQSPLGRHSCPAVPLRCLPTFRLRFLSSLTSLLLLSGFISRPGEAVDDVAVVLLSLEEVVASGAGTTTVLGGE